MTASTQTAFSFCLEKAVPAAFRSLGVSAERAAFTPQIMAGQNGSSGDRLYGWGTGITISAYPARENSMTYLMFPRGSTVVEIDCLRIGTASTIDDTAQRLLDVLEQRADAG